MLNKLTLQQKWALAIIAIILINVLVWLYGLDPALNNVKEVRAEQEGLEMDKMRLEQRLAQLNAIDTAALQEEMEELNIQVPVEGELPEMLIGIEIVAHQLGLNLKRIRAAEARAAEPYQAMDLNIELEGGYSEIFSFIQLLEVEDRMLFVRSFYIRRLVGNTLTTSIDLRMFAEDFKPYTPFVAPGRPNPFAVQ